jgi:hypothetical protein
VRETSATSLRSSAVRHRNTSLPDAQPAQTTALRPVASREPNCLQHVATKQQQPSPAVHAAWYTPSNPPFACAEQRLIARSAHSLTPSRASPHFGRSVATALLSHSRSLANSTIAQRASQPTVSLPAARVGRIARKAPRIHDYRQRPPPVVAAQPASLGQIETSADRW